MRLRFNRQEAAEALAATCTVAAARTPKEILKCVRVEVLPDAMLFSSTDLELGLRVAVTQVEVDEPGDTLVLADTLARIVRECADEVMSAETIGGTLHIRGAGSHFQIVTQAPADFPPVPGLEGEADFTIENQHLRRMIEWTGFAAARESTRYAINGVLWEPSAKELVLAATDGRRLSVAKCKLHGSNTKSPPRAIVPTKTMTLFNRLSGDPEAVVAVKVTSNQIILRLGRAVVSSNLVEGHFPKYQDVIPQDCDRLTELNVAEFLSGLKRAALLTNEESKGVRLAFSEGTLKMTSRAPEQGEAEVSIPVPFKGEPIDIGFNPIFLTDVLRVTPTETLTFAIKEANRPGLIRLADGFLHVVMPVNLNSA